MGITKNQLNAINSGALSKIGQNAEDPSFKATNLLEEMLIGVAQKLTDEIIADVPLFHMVGYTRIGERLNFTPSISTNSELQIAQITFK